MTMDFEGAKWVVGVFMALAGLIIGAFYRLAGKMSGQHAEIYRRIDKVKEDYVRRDDYRLHIERQDKQYEKIESSIQKMDEKIDRLIARK